MRRAIGAEARSHSIISRVSLGRLFRRLWVPSDVVESTYYGRRPLLVPLQSWYLQYKVPVPVVGDRLYGHVHCSASKL